MAADSIRTEGEMGTTITIEEVDTAEADTEEGTKSFSLGNTITIKMRVVIMKSKMVVVVLTRSQAMEEVVERGTKVAEVAVIRPSGHSTVRSSNLRKLRLKKKRPVPKMKPKMDPRYIKV